MMQNLDNLTTEAVSLLMQIIATPSVSRDEAAVADKFEAWLKEMQLNPQRHGNNIWCVCPDYDASKPTLLLDAHLDTVKPVNGWETDPYQPILKDGVLYGLGSNDDGASVVSLLQAFRVLTKKVQSYNLVFSASSEEEVSGKNGFESALPLMPPITVALAGEPTGMHPAVAEKGLMVLDVTAYGKAGHAARNEGDNALYKVLDDIRWFRDYQFEKVSPTLGPVKTSVTMIQAGTQHNVIPDKCSFVVDVRSNDCYSNQEIYELICEHTTCEVKARSFRLNSSGISMEHPLVKKAVEMGRKPFGSPTLSNQALMPFPSMKMGPGDSARSHTANEYIKVDEIREAISKYVELLDGLQLV
ncbi:MAG: M20 family metallo-hydrolase [Bacteroidaceae bacterium]|nr:M20 family metallo-hydrolase [Bacteroidaceae bacterium]